MRSSNGQKSPSGARRQKTSRSRQVPFLLRFFQAVIALRRLLKKLQVMIGFTTIRKKKEGKFLLKSLITSADNQRIDALKGVPMGFMSEIHKPYAEVTVVYGDHFKEEKEIVVEKRSSDVIARAAHQVDEFYRSAHRAPSGTIVPSGASGRLASKLKIPDSKHFQESKSDSSVVSADVADLVAKNYALSANPAENANPAFNGGRTNVETVELLKGVSLYFGGTVSLQAAHGGFLSYQDSGNIKASGHRILPHTKFMILNSDDHTDTSIVKYGDAIWLQAGQYEVLGAHYAGGPILPNQMRKLRPGLVNCFRENMFKAQQYGRWIVLNRQRPTASIGEPVLHLDDVMLEQEWFFLASNSPYDSSLFRTRHVDQIMTRTADLKDLFHPTDECSWKLHIVNLGRHADKESERQKLAVVASDQVDKSKQFRRETMQRIKLVSTSMQVANVDESFIFKTLPHKTNEHLNSKHLGERYIRERNNNFEKFNSPHAMAQAYGADSKILQYKNRAMIMRGQANGSESHLPRKVIKYRSSLEKVNNKYWNQAQGLLVDTQAVGEVPTVMTKYYELDLEKKIKAAILLQRVIRRYLQRKYSSYRSMIDIDRKLSKRIESKINTRRKLLISYATARNKMAGMPSKDPAEDLEIDDLYMDFKVDANDSDETKVNAVVFIDAVQRSRALHSSDIQSSTKERDITRNSFADGRTKQFDLFVDTNVQAKSASAPLSPQQQTRLARAHSANAILRKKQPSDTPALIDSFGGQDNAAVLSVDASYRKIVSTDLMRSKDKDYGLPSDLFENMVSAPNLVTGMRFLRAMSSKPSLFSDVKVVKKRGHSAPSKRK